MLRKTGLFGTQHARRVFTQWSLCFFFNLLSVILLVPITKVVSVETVIIFHPCLQICSAGNLHVLSLESLTLVVAALVK